MWVPAACRGVRSRQEALAAGPSPAHLILLSRHVDHLVTTVRTTITERQLRQRNTASCKLQHGGWVPFCKPPLHQQSIDALYSRSLQPQPACSPPALRWPPSLSLPVLSAAMSLQDVVVMDVGGGTVKMGSARQPDTPK